MQWSETRWGGAKPLRGGVKVWVAGQRSAYPSHAIEHKNEVHDAGN